MRNKIIALVALLLFVGIIAGYFMLRGGADEKKQAATQNKQVEVKLVNDKQTLVPVSSSDGTTFWFSDADGHIYFMAQDGTSLSEYPSTSFIYPPVSDVLWPSVGGDAILVGQDEGKEVFVYFSSSTHEMTSLPKNISAMEWMPDGRKVALIWRSGDNTTQQLVVSNADATGYRNVVALPWHEFIIRVSPNGREALLISTKASGTTNNIYLFNLETGQYNTIINEGRNTDARWISDTKFIFAQLAPPFQKLFTFDISNNQRVDLGINTNLNRVAVDKEHNMIYAAVSTDSLLTDKIVKIDLNQGVNADYYAAEPIRVNRLIYAGGKVFFVDGNSLKLYSVN